MKSLLLIFIGVLFVGLTSRAQDSIPLMDFEDVPETTVINSFFSHRLYNGQTTETLPYGEMKMMIHHRMGAISGKMDNFFGLYQATSKIGFDYGIIDDLTGGIGIGTMQKMFSGYLKYSLFKQTKGAKNFPVAISLYTYMGYSNDVMNFPDRVERNWARFNYFHQILVSRNFNDKLSLQLAPFALHRNLVLTAEDKNTVYGLTAAFSFKLNFKLRLTGEISYIPSGQISSKIGGKEVVNSVTLGFEYKSGKRHVFHWFITNAPAIDEKIWLVENTSKFRMKQLRIGFNIPTTFRILKKK